MSNTAVSFLNLAGNEYCLNLEKEFRFQAMYTPNISYFLEVPLDLNLKLF